MNELMTLKEVGSYLQLHHSTLRRWAAAGGIPAVKVGGMWIVRRCDLENWIDEHNVGGASNEIERSTEQNNGRGVLRRAIGYVSMLADSILKRCLFHQ